jgi:hypothetical protein
LAVPLSSTAQPRRRQARGASAIEYLGIVALVVIPLALMVPGLLHMTALYTQRILTIIALPFG